MPGDIEQEDGHVTLEHPFPTHMMAIEGVKGDEIKFLLQKAKARTPRKRLLSRNVHVASFSRRRWNLSLVFTL
jgi:hypothetical protein